MTGHAKDKGVQLPQQVTDESIVLMQEKRAGAREWDCIGLNKGVLLA